MKIVFFASVYPPDLGAGSFRAVALAKAIAKKISISDKLHIITTKPYRYSSFKVNAKELETQGNITIHRIKVPSHKGGMISHARIFIIFSWHALRICLNLKPDFLIATSSRLMTGVLTWLYASLLKRKYYIDVRDIFSETISDIFSRKSRLLGICIQYIFAVLERRVLKGAIGVNVVSQGFLEYFIAQDIDTSEWSFFPNGIDKEFLNITAYSQDKKKNIKTILYAGNIGSGQGLEKIIPDAAKRLVTDYQFNIIGDGGTIALLSEDLEKKRVKNVNLIPPVNRIELIEYYKRADILFLHLNDLPAFRRCLPSKIFEYAALKKPIIAGLSGGYSEKFIKDNLDYVSLFKPADVDNFVDCIRNIENIDIDIDKVDDFIDKYSRVKIMDSMASQIIYFFS